MTHSVFGQYVPGDSFMHRADPRAKLIGAFVLITVAVIIHQWEALAWLVLATLMTIIAAKIPLNEILRIIWSLRFFYVIIMIIHSVSTVGVSVQELPFGLAITYEGIQRGLYFVVKIILLMLLIVPFMRTTHPVSLSSAIETTFPHKGILRRFSLIFGLSVRFLPILLMETERIRWAQISRGLRTDGNLLQRIRSIGPLIAPLVASSFRRAEHISSAMQVRGFQIDQKRNLFKPLRFGWRDGVVLGVATIVTWGALWTM